MEIQPYLALLRFGTFGWPFGTLEWSFGALALWHFWTFGWRFGALTTKTSIARKIVISILIQPHEEIDLMAGHLLIP